MEIRHDSVVEPLMFSSGTACPGLPIRFKLGKEVPIEDRLRLYCLKAERTVTLPQVGEPLGDAVLKTQVCVKTRNFRNPQGHLSFASQPAI